MKIKNDKKAFTLAELIIVIAVTGVLAAILIPVFSNVIKKAQKADDLTAVRHMNNALKAYSADRSVESISDVMYALALYNIDKYEFKQKGCSCVWDKSENYIFCMDADGNILNPDDYGTEHTQNLLSLDFTEIPQGNNSSTYSELFG